MSAAWWRETRDYFAELSAKGGRDLAVWDDDLLGGSRKVRHDLRIIATAAGRAAAGGAADAGYNTWLTLLREKLQPLRPKYFSVSVTDRTATSCGRD